MNSRERVLASINHQQPDKIAVDFGGTCVTTIHVSCIKQLRDYYGLPKQIVRALEPFTMTGVLDAEMQSILGSDCAIAHGRGTFFGIPRGEDKYWTTPWGQEIIVPKDFNVTEDGNGGYFCYPQGDMSCEASGHLPASGYYFDAVIRKSTFDEDNPKPEDNLEEFGLLSDSDLEYFKKSIDAAYASGRAVVLEAPGMGLGDAAIVPGCALKHPKGIRSIEDWFTAPLLYPDYCMEIFDRQMDIAIENMKRIMAIAEDKIDVIFTCGADLSHQSNTFYSQDTFKEVFFPYYKKANDWIHQNTRWKIFKHNCGAVAPFLPMLIEAGFDIINPVQYSAVGMDPQYLKQEYGDHITFWGGGIDTQKILPFGSAEEVRQEVLKQCEIFGKDGGFVFNTVHNIQPGTPVENIAAVINAIKEFNGND